MDNPYHSPFAPVGAFAPNHMSGDVPSKSTKMCPILTAGMLSKCGIGAEVKCKGAVCGVWDAKRSCCGMKSIPKERRQRVGGPR